MLRLDSPGNLRFGQSDHLLAKFTGGEANVLVAAKRFGVNHCAMASKVPDQAIGHSCLEFLNRYGIDTTPVALGGDRLGILFVESGTSVRPTRVIYDRSQTSFVNSSLDDFDWDEILRGAGVLHITGTAPALGHNVNDLIERSILAAKQAGCLVSFDCSYRSALWGIEQAGSAYRKIAKDCDILFASAEDAKLFFECEDEDKDDRVKRLMDQYEVAHLAFTHRTQHSVSSNSLSGEYWSSGHEKNESSTYQFEVVDRIGSGDAFAAGLISSILQDRSAEDSIEFATAAAVLKHTVIGDFCLVSKNEVEELMAGKSLRIRR